MHGNTVPCLSRNVNWPEFTSNKEKQETRAKEGERGFNRLGRNGTFSGNNKGTIIYQSLTSVNAVTALTNSGLINKYIHYI